MTCLAKIYFYMFKYLQENKKEVIYEDRIINAKQKTIELFV